MSEEKSGGSVSYGKPVVIEEPKKPSPRKRSGFAPGFLVVALVVIMLAIVMSPDSSQSPPAVSPIVPSGGGASSPRITCQDGIATGTTVKLVADQVHVRSSAGYAGKSTADVLRTLDSGDTGQVVAGPERRDGLCWWRVKINDAEGWIADHNTDGTLLLSPSQ
jgi:hypothetical protein